MYFVIWNINPYKYVLLKDFYIRINILSNLYLYSYSYNLLCGHKLIWVHIKLRKRYYISGSTVAYRIVLSTCNQRVGGSSPPSASAPRQGILSTIVSLDPGVVDGYLAGMYSLKCFSASGCRVIIPALWGVCHTYKALYKNGELLLLLCVGRGLVSH